MSEDHIERIAKSAGREAARELLMLLGIDASTPSGIERAQRNFAFLNDLRVGTHALKSKTLMTIVVAMITAVLAYAAIGFRGH